jgi:hypothetical protein
LILSVDEVARIHETLGGVSASLANSVGFTPSGFIYYFWVVPGAIFVLVVLLAYARFLLHLPKSALILFLVAGGFCSWSHWRRDAWLTTRVRRRSE